MQPQLYLEIVLKTCGLPNPSDIAEKFFKARTVGLKDLVTLSVHSHLNRFAKVIPISSQELEFVGQWAKAGFTEINTLPEQLKFRLFQVVQQLGLRVVAVFYGMHTMFSICPKYNHERSTLVSHQDYSPEFWNTLIRWSKSGRSRQSIMVSVSGNALQRLSIPTQRLKFFANHPEWLITICHSEIALDDIDGYVLFARNITFNTCFFKTRRILRHFRRIGNCRFCDVIGSHEHQEWLEARDEHCEL